MQQVRATQKVPNGLHEEVGNGDILDALYQHYVIPYQGRVRAYVRRFPELVIPLVAIPQEVHNYFPHTHLSLDIDHDPEYGIEVGLVVWIHVPHLSVEEAMRKLKQFDDGWWTRHHVPALLVMVSFDPVPEDSVRRGTKRRGKGERTNDDT